MDRLVRGQDVKEMLALLRRDAYAVGMGGVNVQQIEEGIGGMGIVSAEGLQTELSVHEDDCIAGF